MTAPTRDPARVAPDGQRVVDQSGEMAAEQREINRNADLVEATSRVERASEPSTRFWGSRYAQAGPLLALFAGLFTLAIRTWPNATPLGRGTVGVAWFVCATIAGACYVAGFFLSDRHWKRARLVLVSGALLHLLVGFLAAMQVDVQDVAPVSQSIFFDAVPAVAALLAALQIAPAPGQHRE
jgi:RsiW-degrading membrane proteinase PrsW (M82 family)